MERNTLTNIGALQTGDRFYKAGDKSKTTYEVVEYSPGFFKSKKKVVYALWAGVADNIWFDQKAKDARTKEFRRDTEVIFLRNKNDK